MALQSGWQALLKNQGWCATVAVLSGLACGNEPPVERPDPALLMFIGDFSHAGRYIDPMAVDQAMAEMADTAADQSDEQSLPSSSSLPAPAEAGADEAGSAAVKLLPETVDSAINAHDEEQDDAHN